MKNNNKNSLIFFGLFALILLIGAPKLSGSRIKNSGNSISCSTFETFSQEVKSNLLNKFLYLSESDLKGSRLEIFNPNPEKQTVFIENKIDSDTGKIRVCETNILPGKTLLVSLFKEGFSPGVIKFSAINSSFDARLSVDSAYLNAELPNTGKSLLIPEIVKESSALFLKNLSDKKAAFEIRTNAEQFKLELSINEEKLIPIETFKEKNKTLTSIFISPIKEDLIYLAKYTALSLKARKTEKSTGEEKNAKPQSFYSNTSVMSYLPLYPAFSNEKVIISNASDKNKEVSLYLYTASGAIESFNKKLKFCGDVQSEVGKEIKLVIDPGNTVICDLKDIPAKMREKEMKLLLIGAGNSPFGAEIISDLYKVRAIPVFPNKGDVALSWRINRDTSYFLDLYNPESSTKYVEATLTSETKKGTKLKYVLSPFSTELVSLNDSKGKDEWFSLNIPSDVRSHIVRISKSGKADIILPVPVTKSGEQYTVKVNPGSTESSPPGNGGTDPEDKSPIRKADLDTDSDGISDDIDCSPESNLTWRELAFMDGDNDTIPDSSAKESVPCFGSDVPLGFTLNQGLVDNCPFVPNIGQEDLDHDGVGDTCDDLVDIAPPMEIPAARENIVDPFPNPQTYKPSKSNPNGLKGSEKESGK